jgi:hypothetical protein
MNAHRVFVGRPEGERPLDDPNAGRRMIKWIIIKQDAVVWPELIWLRIGTTGGLL